MCTIKKVTAEYTGGGIYCYYGTLEEPNTWLLTSDDWSSVLLLDADPLHTEEAFDISWQQEHTIAEIIDEEFDEFRQTMIEWILANKPTGNYSIYEMETRLYPKESED